MRNIGESHQMKFTPNELWYKLFKKKTCPICGNKMGAFKIKSYKGIGKAGTRGHMYKAKIYQYKQYYKCNICDKLYPISELSSMEKKRYK